MKKLRDLTVMTPWDEPCGNPADAFKERAGDNNGEPGMEKRTPSPNGVPEVTYESEHPKGDSSTGTFVSTPAKPPYGR